VFRDRVGVQPFAVPIISNVRFTLLIEHQTVSIVNPTRLSYNKKIINIFVWRGMTLQSVALLSFGRPRAHRPDDG
jgi:hypothetical protein